MSNVREIYNQTIKPLSEHDREELMGLILDDLKSEPPNTIRNAEHLEKLLLEGMNSPRIEVNAETWKLAHSELERRLSTSTQ